jgi:hypothetical protein
VPSLPPFTPIVKVRELKKKRKCAFNILMPMVSLLINIF